MATLRDYRDEDLAACMDLVNQAWDFDGRLGNPDLSGFIKDFYVTGPLAESRHYRVIEEDQRVLGLIFGRCGPGKVYRTDYTGVRGRLRAAGRLLSLRGWTLGEKFAWLKAIQGHEAARARVMRQTGTEITLLVVESVSQGKGLGRQLMDEYVEQCRRLGKERITVETDVHANFGFYEHYGFVLVGEFGSPMNELFTGGSGRSFVYELAI